MSIKERLDIKDADDLCRQIEDFIRQSMADWQGDGCILGISGGLDSALVAYLAVRAVGKSNVKALFLPERDSAQQTLDMILMGIEMGMDYDAIAQETGTDPSTVDYVERLIQLSKPMRELPPQPSL